MSAYTQDIFGKRVRQLSTQFGGILKERRKEKKLTLTQIAELTGLSAAYLSLLERNMNSPTIENLNKVCAVLDLTLSDLIERASARKEILSHPGQRAFLFNEPGYTYEAAFEGSRSINCIIMTVRDQENHTSTAHVADEIGYVVQGAMIVTVNGVEYAMTAGDFIYVEANQNHSYRKTSEEDCVSVWSYAASPGHDTVEQYKKCLNSQNPE